MSHALDNGDVDKAFVHLKKCSNMAAKFNKLRVVLISKRSQVRHTTLKKNATTIIRNTCYGSVFEQCQETRRYTSDALRASSSISVDETDWNMSEIFWEHVCLRWKKNIYILYMESRYLSLHSCIYELTTTCESNGVNFPNSVCPCLYEIVWMILKMIIFRKFARDFNAAMFKWVDCLSFFTS